MSQLNSYNNWQLIKDLKVYIKPYRWKFLLGSIIRFLGDLIWLYPIYAIGEVITFVSSYQVGEGKASTKSFASTSTW